MQAEEQRLRSEMSELRVMHRESMSATNKLTENIGQLTTEIRVLVSKSEQHTKDISDIRDNGKMVSERVRGIELVMAEQKPLHEAIKSIRNTCIGLIISGLCGMAFFYIKFSS